jgi:hypothetical protein
VTVNVRQLGHAEGTPGREGAPAREVRAEEQPSNGRVVRETRRDGRPEATCGAPGTLEVAIATRVSTR